MSWREISSEELWLELVIQFAVIGGRAPVERMRANGILHELGFEQVHTAALISTDEARWRIHRLLAINGVRYAGVQADVPCGKAHWIVSAALTPELVGSGGFQLGARLAETLPGEPWWTEESRERERQARRWLVRVVDGIGMKSASDLVGRIGASVNLLAFDSRILTLLRRCFGPGPEVARYVDSIRSYEALERPFVEDVCPTVGLHPCSSRRGAISSRQRDPPPVSSGATGTSEMKPGLRVGMSAEKVFPVTMEMRPIFDGEVVHDVLATSWMISFMEQVARGIVLPFLEEGETGAGVEVSVRHLAPLAVGSTATCRAEVVGIKGNKVTCTVECRTDGVIIGRGTFTQVAIKKSRFEVRTIRL